MYVLKYNILINIYGKKKSEIDGEKLKYFAVTAIIKEAIEESATVSVPYVTKIFLVVNEFVFCSE